MTSTRKSFVDAARASLAGLADDTPIVMINLLLFRERAAYAEGAGVEACSGREAYRRYGNAAFEFITGVGGQVIWQGNARALVIGPPTERWDKALLVRYPSKQAFLEMVGNPGYKAIVFHRTAALEDSRLIATLPSERKLSHD
jgi:uncharacterized protein (DUF1330 family)